MGLGIVISMGWLGGLCALTGAEEISLPTSSLRLGDVVALECVPEADRPAIGALVLAEVPQTSRRATVSAGDLALLAKRRVPGLRLAPVGDASRQIALLAGPAGMTRPAAPVACYRTSHTISANDAISGEDLAPSACEQNAPRPQVYFDRTNKVVRAQADIAADVYLGRLLVPDHGFPDTGDELVLSIGVGPVRVERQVRAAQPAPKGGEIFVRDEAGALFRAPVAPHSTEGERQ